MSWTSAAGAISGSTPRKRCRVLARRVRASCWWASSRAIKRICKALGGTALKSVLQDGGATMKSFMDAPFQHEGRWVVVVYHPSFALRARDEASRRQAYQVIVDGLRQALRLLDKVR